MHAAGTLASDESGRATFDLTKDWLRWCRLCAKDDGQNINIFFKDEHMIMSAENMERKELRLAIAILKYFCVQIKEEEQLPNRLCTECFSLVTSLVNFNERVAKVQRMYVSLQNMKDFANIDFQALRQRYEVMVDDEANDFIYHPLAETHFFESKPKTNDYEESNFVDEAGIEIIPQGIPIGTGIKKEHSTDITPATDEDVYDFGNEKAEGEDPFGSDDEVLNDSEKVCCATEKRDGDCNGTTDTTTNSSKIIENKNDESRKIDTNNVSNKNYQINYYGHNTASTPSSNTIEVTPHEKEQQKTIYSIGKEKEQIYICSECSQTFKRISNYRSHMERKHAKTAAVPRFVCSECHFSFNTQTQLNHHAVKHLPLTKRRVVPCPYCEQKFPTKTYVAQHVKYVHMNERSFICEECGEAVRSKGQLKQHMLTHTDYTPFECEVCRKGFKNQVRLKNHMETHNPNKHICAECGLQLNSRATLNRHLLVHSDVMQHKCDYCGRAFKRAKALKNHLILHTGLKPYSCDFCDRTFANGSNCRTHKRKAHPEELAALEASGEKTYTKNIPKLAVLKSVTRAAENLAPVVSKQSGNFAFGKKPKLAPNAIGTVSSKQSKIRKQTAAPIKTSNELIDRCSNVAGHSILSDAQSDSHHTNGDNNTGRRNIPTIDNIYSHLMKQTTPNSGFAIAPATAIDPMHLDIKRARSVDTSPANDNCVGIDIPNIIVQHQQQFAENIQQPVIPSAVQSFCTQFIKRHKITVEQQQLELHQQHNEMSVHSPDSHASHLTEENSTASANEAKGNHFFNHMSQHTPVTYL